MYLADDKYNEQVLEEYGEIPGTVIATALIDEFEESVETESTPALPPQDWT